MDIDPEDPGQEPEGVWAERAPRHRRDLPSQSLTASVSLRLDPEDPDYLGRRFLGLCYRTTRATLALRSLLVCGQSLAEAFQLYPDLFERSPTRPLPPTHSVLPPGNEALLHTYTALQIGIDPEDPVLFWLEENHFPTSFPDPTNLLDFEAAFLPQAGKALIRSGRHRALQRLESILGPIHQLERRDYLALPYAYLREFTAISAEEERTLAVARLEALVDRARSSLDPRVELAALRQIHTLQGLNFQDPEKGHRELIMLLSKPEAPSPPLQLTPP